MCRCCCLEPHTDLIFTPLLDLLPSGSRQVHLAVPGAYEKPQVLPLQPPPEPGPPRTFTFHVNPVLNSRLDVDLKEKLRVLQVSTKAKGGMMEAAQPREPPEVHFLLLWVAPLGAFSAE